MVAKWCRKSHVSKSHPTFMEIGEMAKKLFQCFVGCLESLLTISLDCLMATIHEPKLGPQSRIFVRSQNSKLIGLEMVKDAFET